MSDAVADIDRDGIAITERILDDINSVTGGFGQAGLRAAIAAHQLLWTRYMVTGTPSFGEAVLRSLQMFCCSARVDSADGGTSCADARLLELLTWVWRVERCPELRTFAEAIVERVVTEARVPGRGFAEDAGAEGRGHVAQADANGLTIVALIEAGSVFERREWLTLAREVFDELVLTFPDAGGRDAMSRAALRLFEAFGKPRYLDLAESWVYAPHAAGRSDACDVIDRSSSLDDSLKLGILARLHTMTGVTRYAERAKELVGTLRPAAARSDIAAAAADPQTAARLVSIKVSGDPRLTETRELMRIALDHGLPDRLVLGPGAGGARGERPFAQISVGTLRLAPIDDAARLRTMLAPGGLAAAFIRREACETVDSRTGHGLT